jgi:hypothetical protein
VDKLWEDGLELSSTTAVVARALGVSTLAISELPAGRLDKKSTQSPTAPPQTHLPSDFGGPPLSIDFLIPWAERWHNYPGTNLRRISSNSISLTYFRRTFTVCSSRSIASTVSLTRTTSAAV